ncbi:LysM peptidoglycan-binding domain-containing protein, partial [Halobacillus sp. BBL2006]|uniref:LysM peptidoglycan-binding domain-containing protein n=1 Tax=Halobacillus sp. BBL2006 TaxID=1543706 RepID=UPI0012E05BC0
GSVNSAVLNTVGSAGYTHTIHWTIDTLDWKGISKDEVTNRVMSNIVPGSIILMHTGAGASGTPDALPTIISQLNSRGYQFVTVSEILNLTPSSGRTYTVKPGDTLYRIALNNQVKVSELASVNHLSNPSFIQVGQVLVIPSKVDNSSKTYTVMPGDTLYRIALRFQTTVSKLVSVNQLANPSLIKVGQVLLLPGSSASTYTVQPGDTLYSIARRYGTTVQKIADANQISNPSVIRAGTKLVIPT